MFAEEEWAESPSADGLSEAVVKKVSSAPGREKVVSKRSLLRTLQTLGSVPDWDTKKPCVDSDEEQVEVSAPNKTKKKRCKKRRKNSNVDNEGEQNGRLDLCETPAKKKKKETVKKIKKEPGNKVSKVSSNNESDKGDSVETEGDLEQRLSRKQWKNKMKNKKRCKNKYLQKTTQDDNAKAEEEPLGQSKDVPAKQKVQKDQRSSKKIKKSHVKNGIVSVKDNVKKAKDSTLSISSDHLQCIKVDTCTEAQAGDDCVGNIDVSHEMEDKGKPQKMTKKSQVRADKLRHILKLHRTSESNKDKDEQVEHNNKTVNSKGDEEQVVPDRSSVLRSKMEKRLEAARFRHINELLYTSTSGEAKRMFQQDPKAIGIYHRGYTAQVQHWPANPVDSIISYICQRPSSLVVADFGCGDCKIARSVKNKVYSFDLVPVCDLATACDMSKVPLRDSTVDIVVFCLSLMGTNLGDFLAEANRVLVMGGILKIAEVASRFENVRSFTGAMLSLGFKLVNKDTENSHFFSFEFIKTGKAPENVKKAGLNLRPCLYKKR